MSKSRFLQIQFDQPFQAYDIPRLRAAIIEKTKRESDLFHNHFGSDGYVYRYPLIQYKIKNRKPCLICLREATEDIHYLLRERDYNFVINGTPYNMEIEEVYLSYFDIRTLERDLRYNIHNYIALNQPNFEHYKTLDSLVEKIGFLQEMLYKHLSIFAEEMEADMPVPLRTEILEIKEEKYIKYKGIYHLTFSLNFKTNLTIPNYVGIGKGVSVGFGMVKKLGDRR